MKQTRSASNSAVWRWPRRAAAAARRPAHRCRRRWDAAAAGAKRPCRARRQADFTLRIAPVTVELDRAHILSTIGYNGTSPGPVLRMREGKPVTVEVINDTDTPELVHWHGMLIPPDVDGTEEEGSPMVRAARPAPFPVHSGTSRQPLVPLARHGHGRPAQRRLHRAVRLCVCGRRKRSRRIRPGAVSRSARLGAVLLPASMEDDDDDTHDGPLLEKPAVHEHRPRRARSEFDDLLHQRQGAGIGRPDSRDAKGRGC